MGGLRVLGYALLVLLTGLIVVRWAGLDRVTPLIQAMVVVPYLTGLVLIAMLVLFGTGRRGLALWAAVILVAYFAALLPRWAVSPDTPPKGFTLRVMTANLHSGQADAKALVRLIGRRHPDLLAVQELTPGEATALADAGIGRYLPSQVLRTGPKTTGSALYSESALTHGGALSPDSTYQMARGQLTVGERRLDVVSVHTCPPLLGRSASHWARDMRLLPSTGRPGTQLLVGDFNATDDQHEFRQLTHGGYLDATGSVGSGLAPTWHRWPVPPVQLDHVLLDKAMTATKARTDHLPGADHKVLTVRLVVHAS